MDVFYYISSPCAIYQFVLDCYYDVGTRSTAMTCWCYNSIPSFLLAFVNPLAYNVDNDEYFKQRTTGSTNRYLKVNIKYLDRQKSSESMVNDGTDTRTLACMTGTGNEMTKAPIIQHNPPIILPINVTGTISPYLAEKIGCIRQ